MSGGGGWGCPHEVRGKCQRVKGRPCDPGMKGCILYGRFEFSNPGKNRPARRARTGARVTVSSRRAIGAADSDHDRLSRAGPAR